MPEDEPDDVPTPPEDAGGADDPADDAAGQDDPVAKAASADGTEGDDRDGPAAPSGRHSRRKPDEARRGAPLWLETAILLGVALGMALIIKTFFVQAFYIPSESMEPGLVKNDRILVEKVSYWFGRDPQRGDVVVFQDPGGWLNGTDTGPQTRLAKALSKVGLYPTGGHLVKRVIGTPGDEIVCCDDEGRLSINGVAIDEDDFIAPQPKCDGPMPSNCRRDWTVVVPEDRLFVMGDNREHSADSSARLCGPDRKKRACEKAFVPIELVVGKVFALVWPLGHAEFIGRPDAFESIPDAD